MKRILKLTIAAIITVSLFVTATLPSFALPKNTDMVDSYTMGFFEEPFSAPDAYTVRGIYNYLDLGLGEDFDPVDLLVKGDKLYVVDAGNNAIHIIDSEYHVVKSITELKNSEEYEIPDVIKTVVNENGEEVVDTQMLTANRYGFYNPQGIFVADDGTIYVADMGNRRIVVCNEDGVVSNIIQGVKIGVLGDTYIFQPRKLIVDAAGGINVLGYGVNRGIMVFDDDGTFRQFTGAPNVSVSAIEWFWRMLATEEQKANLAKYVPTEYSNITVDDRGFTYATISSIDADTFGGVTAESTDGTPIKKLSASGLDTLRRKGKYAIVGDTYRVKGSTPLVVDVCVNSDDIYTMLDQRSGRFYTYSPDGDFLYVGGGTGSKVGRFMGAESIALRGDEIIVSDITTGTLTVFELTTYAKTINKAIAAHNNGDYENAQKLWADVITYNSTFYIAYIGMGKAEMRKASDSSISHEDSMAHYQQALEYFSAANETEHYSKAFKQLQKEEMSKNFLFIAIGFVVIVAGCIVLYFLNKKRKEKKAAAEKAAFLKEQKERGEED